MKFGRTAFFRGASLTVAIVSLVWGAAAGIRAKKQMNSHVFYVAPVLNEPSRYFSLDQVRELENYEVPALISYESVSESQIAFDKMKAYAKTTRTNHSYFWIHNIQFTEGGPWTDKGQDDRAIVINESLAWQLFGSLNAVGGEVTVGNHVYRITGVVKDGKIAKASCSAWLPYQPDNSDDKGITSLFIQPSQYNPLASYQDVIHMLNSLDKADRLYNVIDIDRYIEGINARYKLLFFMMGAYGIFFLGCQLYTFVKSRPVRAKTLLPFSFLLLLHLVLIVLLWNHIQFDLWIPKFSGTVLQRVKQAVLNEGLLPPQAYLSSGALALSRLNDSATMAFIMGCIGFVYFVFCGKRYKGEHGYEQRNSAG